ncbi:MAG TPA: zinc-binding dehydrogenase [Ktedonobacteraceae bacterium]|nr:zinc-binding dehydrogenase [Ktedonobacteraceae bacterium]
MANIQAVVVNPAAPARLALGEVAYPTTGPDDALVRVEAISLNLGEVRNSQAAQAGHRPGWDFAGVVEQAAANGSGPRKGARVVGMLNSGAWAQIVAAPTSILAELPAAVSFAQASTLPIAGLTALRALEKGGSLLEKPVLINGASGGVGHLAVQIAHHMGAHVVAAVRRASLVGMVQQAGAERVIVSEDLSNAAEFGPYDHILESVGGKALGNALAMLKPWGMCVCFGSSGSYEATFDLRKFFLTGGATLYGFIIFSELARNPGSADLARLARMVADGTLHPEITVEAPWTQIGEIAQRLLNRQISGKAVLHVSG